MLYIKKEKVLDKRALKGVADNGTADNNGPIFKEIRPVKLDFSATNFKAKVTGWRLSIENKADTLFPTVCDTARGIAGIAAATVTQLEHQDPQILSRANLASEDEDSAAEHEDDTQAIDEGHSDGFDEHRDNGGDDTHEGHGDGFDEHRDNGGDDTQAIDECHGDGFDEHRDNGVEEDHNNGGDDLDGHDNEGGSEEDEEKGKARVSDSGLNDGDNYDNDHNDETEEESHAGGSDLTEIDSSSDASEISCRKGVRH